MRAVETIYMLYICKAFEGLAVSNKKADSLRRGSYSEIYFMTAPVPDYRPDP